MLFFALSTCSLNAQTVWTGPTITFTKANNADWTLEEHQDRITDNLWITRQGNRGLFNIVVESSDADGDACTGPEPSDTEWAYGTTADYSSLNYVALGSLNGCDFENIIDSQNIVLHLITDDIYIDLKFTSWTTGGGGGGGGFSYERSTDQPLSSNELELDKKIILSPNPSTEFIQVSGLTGKENYIIYNSLGTEIKNGNVFNQGQIDIKNINNGIYFLKLDNGNTLKFIKK